jgi:hypothetical protein
MLLSTKANITVPAARAIWRFALAVEFSFTEGIIPRHPSQKFIQPHFCTHINRLVMEAIALFMQLVCNKRNPR